MLPRSVGVRERGGHGARAAAVAAYVMGACCTMPPMTGAVCWRAAFVCASAVGMALGPLLSLLLARLPETHVLGLTLNPITAAGWIMAAVWVAFIFLWLGLFQEPLARCAACAWESAATQDAMAARPSQG